MDNKKYTSNQNYAISIVAGNTVLVPVADSVAHLDNMMLFNESAAEIVKMLEEGMTVADVADYMLAEYDEAPERKVVVAEVESVAQQMVDNGYFSEL